MPVSKIWLDDQRTAPTAVSAGPSVKSQVVPSTEAIEYDEQLWPHSDDKPQDKTVTYTNDGEQPAQLALDAVLKAPDGTPAPASAVSLSASSLTVPARGTAQVVVTSNTNHVGPDRRYVAECSIAADAQTVSVRTTATDSHGNTVDQEIDQAYQLRH